MGVRDVSIIIHKNRVDAMPLLVMGFHGIDPRCL